MAMKSKLIFLLCLLFSGLISLSQERKELNEIKVTPPKFTGVERIETIPLKSNYVSLEKYLIKIIEPQLVKDRKTIDEGTVVMQFTVNPSGELTDFHTLNSVSPEIDEHVIKALKTTNGMWKPGSNNDELIAMEKEISISFRLENTPKFETRAKWLYKRGGKMLYVKAKPEKALKYFDYGMALLPNDKGILVNRGLARYELGDMAGACSDWNRIKSLGGFEGDSFLENFCDMKGYAQLTQILKND